MKLLTAITMFVGLGLGVAHADQLSPSLQAVILHPDYSKIVSIAADAVKAKGSDMTVVLGETSELKLDDKGQYYFYIPAYAVREFQSKLVGQIVGVLNNSNKSAPLPQVKALFFKSAGTAPAR
jgi:hypothetical protein